MVVHFVLRFISELSCRLVGRAKYGWKANQYEKNWILKMASDGTAACSIILTWKGYTAELKIALTLIANVLLKIQQQRIVKKVPAELGRIAW
jgi:hypothetical protein